MLSPGGISNNCHTIQTLTRSFEFVRSNLLRISRAVVGGVWRCLYSKKGSVVGEADRGALGYDFLAGLTCIHITRNAHPSEPATASVTPPPKRGYIHNAPLFRHIPSHSHRQDSHILGLSLRPTCGPACRVLPPPCRLCCSRPPHQHLP